jgi:hypothetical protein
MGRRGISLVVARDDDTAFTPEMYNERPRMLPVSMRGLSWGSGLLSPTSFGSMWFQGPHHHLYTLTAGYGDTVTSRDDRVMKRVIGSIRLRPPGDSTAPTWVEAGGS